MEIRKMELAFEKTKALILYGHRKRDSVSFKIRNTEIIIASLSKLMPNVGGPMGRTRKILLNGVANSIILYEAPIWYKAYEIANHRERLLSTQRKSLLRITCTYRTASNQQRHFIL